MELCVSTFDLSFGITLPADQTCVFWDVPFHGLYAVKDNILCWQGYSAYRAFVVLLRALVFLEFSTLHWFTTFIIGKLFE